MANTKVTVKTKAKVEPGKEKKPVKPTKPSSSLFAEKIIVVVKKKKQNEKG